MATSRTTDMKLQRASFSFFAANGVEVEIGREDVIVGKGKGAYLSDGNQHYMQLIKNNYERHQEAKNNVDKLEVVKDIIAAIAKRGGRFLSLDADTGKLALVPDKQARVKVGQALRHKRRQSRRSTNSSNGSTNGAADAAKRSLKRPSTAISNGNKMEQHSEGDPFWGQLLSFIDGAESKKESVYMQQDVCDADDRGYASSSSSSFDPLPLTEAVSDDDESSCLDPLPLTEATTGDGATETPSSLEPLPLAEDPADDISPSSSSLEPLPLREFVPAPPCGPFDSSSCPPVPSSLVDLLKHGNLAATFPTLFDENLPCKEVCPSALNPTWEEQRSCDPMGLAV